MTTVQDLRPTRVEVQGKVTIYRRSGFGMGMVKIEATQLLVEVKPWAQHQTAVIARCLPKKKRLVRTFDAEPVTSHPSTLVLEGWGHPDPDGIYCPPTVGKSSTGVIVQKSRYGSVDPRWQKDFDAKIGAYLSENKSVRVIADYRDAALSTVDNASIR